MLTELVLETAVSLFKFEAKGEHLTETELNFNIAHELLQPVLVENTLRPISLVKNKD